jgi:hypothetical protein
MGTQCTQYSTRWRFLLLRNRGVNTPLPHLRATTVLTASYIFGNRRREDGHTVNQIGPDDQMFESRSGKQIVFFKTSTQPRIPGAKATGASS